jgi:E3 ubiquitin-protein ligase RNF14
MTDDMASDVEDERQTELSSISAIFPEILLNSDDPFAASLDLAVTPSVPLPVAFPESSGGAPLAVPSAAGQVARLETHLLSHLPCLHLEIVLPKGYPAQLPPSFKLSTTPKWLSRAVLDRLESDGERLWEEFGHDQTVFAYIDHLQQASEDAFGVLNDKEYLEVPQDQKLSLLDFNNNAKRAAFEKETFDCGICLGKFLKPNGLSVA